MCRAPKPKPVKLPPERQLAQAPQYINAYNSAILNSSQAGRSTVVNPSGFVASAPVATLGGTSVVLGG